MSKTKAGAILWIFCLHYFVAEAVAIHGWPGPYSLSLNYISDLGAVGCDAPASGLAGPTQILCSPLHALMNASFVLQGLLIAGGAALLRPLFPKGGSWTGALWLIGASGVGVFVVGLAPEDASPGPHFLGAVENFLCCNAGMTAIGLAMLSSGRATRAAGLVAFSLGAIGLIAFGFLAMRTYHGLGVGGMERVTAYPFPLWLAGMGARLLRGPLGRLAEL